MKTVILCLEASTLVEYCRGLPWDLFVIFTGVQEEVLECSIECADDTKLSILTDKPKQGHRDYSQAIHSSTR